MEYMVSDRKFELDYKELRLKYDEIVQYDDSMFIEKIKEVMHFVCIVSYLKNIPTSVLMIDDGLMHELVHLIDGVETVNDLSDIRNDFNLMMKLS